MTELEKKITTETLLKKLPLETCWAITGETLTRLAVYRILKTSTPFLGKDDGIFSLLSGWDKETEIKWKVYSEAGSKMYPFVKEMFNIPVENAIDVAKLYTVTGRLLMGPSFEFEQVEVTPERAVFRCTKCPYWEAYEEKEATLYPELIPCGLGHEAFQGEGFKAINPKITHTLVKSRPRGDPYCEDIFEFKDE